MDDKRNVERDDKRIVERLDMLIALVRLSHGPRIDEALTTIRSDPVASGVLEALRGAPLPAGVLKSTVARVVKVSEKTVQRSVVELVDRGLVRASGVGPARTYESAGVA